MGRKNKGKAKQNFQKAGKMVVPDGTFNKYGGQMAGGLGETLGNFVGLGDAGRQVGEKLGGFLGKKLSHLVGFGDYKVVQNSLLSHGGALQPGSLVPSFKMGRHCVRVAHREYVTDLVSTVDATEFVNRPFTINVGNPFLFPWLSSLAGSFQQYRIVGMVVEFHSTFGEVTAGGALGSVTLATDYNVLADPFPSKVKMDNSEYCSSAKPSVDQLHTIECARDATASNLLYVRNGNTESSTATSDNRLYDLGKFQIATKGLPSADGTALGEIWVSYDVELYKPVSSAATTLSALAQGSDDLSPATIFGSTPIVSGVSISAVDNTITFEVEGDYLISLRVEGTNLLQSSTGGTLVRVGAGGAATSTDVLNDWIATAYAGDTFIFDFSSSTTIEIAEVRVAPYNFSYGGAGPSPAYDFVKVRRGEVQPRP